MEETELYFIVGRKIKILREKKGLTQLDLSSLCDMEKTNISRIESGKTNLTLKNLYKIATALETSMSEIVAINELDMKYL